MKRFTSTRLFAIVCMIVMGFVQTWALDNTTVKVEAPTITPGSCKYNGTIMPVITADEGCSIVYVKSTSKLYKTVEDIDKNQGVKTENSNKTTITDIINKTGNRYISAYATKDVNGQTYKSAVTNVTYTYNKDANTKKDITLSASSIKLDMANPNVTKKLNIIAKDAKGNTISGLTYSFTVYPEGIVTVASDGTVTPKAAGTASINVIFEGNDNYNAATCVVDVNVASNAIGKVFYSIADIRHATQSSTDKSKKNDKCVLIFTENNPATVIAVMKNSDSNYEDSKFIGSYFIIDNSNRGLWIRANDIYPSTNLKIGSKITGTYLASYTQNDKMVPSLYEFSKKDRVIDGNTYKYEFNIDHSGEANGDKPATYPYTAVEDVNTISKNNDENGDIVQASYGVYQNSIVSVPGIIRLGAGGEYYLVQDENSGWDEKNNSDKRLIINTQQIGVNLADYVNTVGTFEGILIKRGIKYAQLIVLKNNFYQINKIYLDENDDEKRIDDLVNAGAFDDEVDVYVHRTKLVNSNDTWGTLCFPFDLTKEEFKTAFGCDLTALAAPKWDGEQQDNGRLTKIGTVNDNNLVFEKVSNLNITEGMPYLFKASGEQSVCTNNNIKYKNDDGTIKTPQDLIKEDERYYAHIGQKTITVVPPHQIRGYINNNVVNGNFYFRGLYGSKQYTEDKNGNLTTTPISDSGSQKYQFISTATGNYLKYLKSGSTSKFPGFRAYFYFPGWSAEENNKLHSPTDTNNSKVFLFVEGSTTGISDIRTDENNNDGRIYNLAGQVVDESYKGIVIKNGRKYLAK
ncbi:MAG TPA: hypothetical protein PLP97_05005 [Prevotella sp.]|nr:hypothetical protein [Prevotella sp.]